MAIVDEDVLDRFGVDTIELGRGFALEEAAWADWTLPDGTPCKMPAWALPERRDGEWVFRSATGRVIGRMPDGALYFEQCHWPFLEHDDLEHLAEAFAESMWTALRSPPGAPGLSAEDLAAGARRLRERTDRAIIGLFGGNLLETGQFLYRNDNFLMLLAGEPARAHEFLDRLVEIHLANLERFLGAVGPYIDIILFGDDLGMQTGPQMSPAMYREFFKPRHARDVAAGQGTGQRQGHAALLRRRPDAAARPDRRRAGRDQPGADLLPGHGRRRAEARLRRGPDVLGRRLRHAGRSSPTARPTQVRAHVREQVAILAPGGGFVFQQVHNIMANVPPENIVAMFDAVLDH